MSDNPPIGRGPKLDIYLKKLNPNITVNDMFVVVQADRAIGPFANMNAVTEWLAEHNEESIVLPLISYIGR